MPRSATLPRSSSSPANRLGRPSYRTISAADIPTLAEHRHAMWSEIGHRTEEEISEHDRRYRRWIRARLRAKEVLGILAEDGEGRPVGSGIVWFRADQPRPKIPFLTTPYIHSMYTVPEWRGRGIASRIVRRLVHECRLRGYPSVILHASEQGRPVYARLGFERTWEMRLWIDPVLRRRRQAMARAEAMRERKGQKRLDRSGITRSRTHRIRNRSRPPRPRARAPRSARSAS